MGNLSFDFNGWNVLVTGGTRGIGKAVAMAFWKSGADVLAVYSSGQDAAEKAMAETAGVRFSVHQADVSDYEAVERLYKELDLRWDKLHVLVNSAGIRRDAIVGAMPKDDWDRVLDINLTGSFHMAKQAVMRMSGQRFGRIVSITSPSGRIGFPGQANYAASKAGQVALTRSLAAEVAKRGITANCVSPGFIETDLIADLTDETKAKYRQMVPANRFGMPEEVADAVLYLSSKEAAYVNGSVLEISGGL